ncbi:hypothetical protein L195_g044067, partial [Trifolium pratense]
EYLTNPVQAKVGKVSSPAINVSQTIVKVSESEKLHASSDLLDMRQHVHIKTRCDEVAEALVAKDYRQFPCMVAAE